MPEEGPAQCGCLAEAEVFGFPTKVVVGEQPERRKQILCSAYPIARICALGPQACFAQDDRGGFRGNSTPVPKVDGHHPMNEGLFVGTPDGGTRDEWAHAPGRTPDASLVLESSIPGLQKRETWGTQTLCWRY